MAGTVTQYKAEKLGCVVLLLYIGACTAAEITISNKCGDKIRVAISSVSGELGLEPGQSASVGVPAASWTGMVWAKTYCSDNNAGKLSCLTGDDGSAFTQAELDLHGPAGVDRYRVSLVNGFNLGILLLPLDSRCKSTGCVTDLNKACPDPLPVTVTGGTTIACQVQPTSFSSDFFHSQCALGNLYFSCSPTCYHILFCPAPTRFHGNHNGHEMQNLLASFVAKVIGAIIVALITAGCSVYISIGCGRRVR